MLHSVVNTKSDTNSCVTNEERDLEKFKPCLLYHLCTAGKSLREVGVNVNGNVRGIVGHSRPSSDAGKVCTLPLTSLSCCHCHSVIECYCANTLNFNEEHRLFTSSPSLLVVFAKTDIFEVILLCIIKLSYLSHIYACRQEAATPLYDKYKVIDRQYADIYCLNNPKPCSYELDVSQGVILLMKLN